MKAVHQHKGVTWLAFDTNVLNHEIKSMVSIVRKTFLCRREVNGILNCQIPTTSILLLLVDPRGDRFLVANLSRRLFLLREGQ